ncbi:hypothetical protein GY45DRAFT_1303924 [Cubamyces sp. BRFM 1775]|nr:hypothetical protein GY45DRAFT_1303924 [Cubamyces sp. BRFM 1775]
MSVGRCISVASRVARTPCSRNVYTLRPTSILYGRAFLRSLSTPASTEPVAADDPAPSPEPARKHVRRPNKTEENADEKKKKKPLRNPRNEEIKLRFVRLVNPETGALEPPVPPRQILARVNRKHEYLELVAENPEAIVRIQSTKALYEKSKAKKFAQASGKAPEEKEVQLTWSVGPGDLQYKLKKVREDLNDGNRVSIVFAPKKGQPIPSPAGQRKLVDEALSLLEDVGREWKEREVRRHAIGIFLEGTRTKKRVELRWVYGDSDSWEGLKSVDPTLRRGDRVELIFNLPPPPKKEKGLLSDSGDSRGVDPELVQGRVERTLQTLSEVGKEWKPRDVRKGVIIVHLEGVKPPS